MTNDQQNILCLHERRRQLPAWAGGRDRRGGSSADQPTVPVDGASARQSDAAAAYAANDRQRAAIEALEPIYGAGGAKGSARNQAFFDALLRENRWAAGELRPAQACRVAVLSVLNPPHMQPPQLKEQEVGA